MADRSTPGASLDLGRAACGRGARTGLALTVTGRGSFSPAPASRNRHIPTAAPPARPAAGQRNGGAHDQPAARRAGTSGKWRGDDPAFRRRHRVLVFGGAQAADKGFVLRLVESALDCSASSPPGRNSGVGLALHLFRLCSSEARCVLAASTHCPVNGDVTDLLLDLALSRLPAPQRLQLGWSGPYCWRDRPPAASARLLLAQLVIRGELTTWLTLSIAGRGDGPTRSISASFSARSERAWTIWH